VLSDVHLSDAEPSDPARPLWKRFKQRDFFIDDSFARFLDHVREVTDGEVELVFNGDIFDFDSVMGVPAELQGKVGWLERRRGMQAEERKSSWKMARILADHPSWVDALRSFLQDGHRVVFIIGNHDLELHWPGVRSKLMDALALDPVAFGRVRFCEFFYVSNGDTLIEHGNQFDSYCLCADPINPLIGMGPTPRLRMPFGNIAGRLMLNGMGFFNPHVEESFIRPLREYVVFFYRHIVKVQPFLVLTWLWSAMATLIVSVRDGLLPSIKKPLELEATVEDIAHRANTRPGVVRTLHALTVHPAIFNPWMIARELWLDRAMLLLLVGVVSFQSITVLNLFVSISVWWLAVPLAILLPPFVFYAHTVNSDVNNVERAIHKRLPVHAQVVGVKRVVLGHTHRERHTGIEGVELINTGTWSPAFHDIECTIPYGRKCFAWIHPDPASEGRVSELRVWLDPGSEVIRPEAPPRPRLPGIDIRRRTREERELRDRPGA
jgi:UDP-2,3-diacylglucosamine pyrophosphatase LpxH